MFQGMTLGEQRTLLALVAVITLGLGYKAYQDRQAMSSVYVEKGQEELTAPADEPAKAATSAAGAEPTADADADAHPVG